MGYLNGVLMYVLSKAGNLCSSDFKAIYLCGQSIKLR